MKKNDLAVLDCLMGQSDNEALTLLSDIISKSGNAWQVVKKPVFGAVHIKFGNDLYASDENGRAESYIANWIRAHDKDDIEPVPLRTHHGLTDNQAAAASILLKRRISCLSGLPGTGKTYTAAEICRAYDRAGFRVGGCAYTGVASKRLAESTGFPSSTIYKMLGFDGEKFTSDIPYQVLLCDEASFLSNGIALSLISRLPEGGRIIFLGDTDQLYGMEPGAIFHELCRIVSHARLTEILRTEDDSPIGIAAGQVLQGKMPETNFNAETKTGFFLLQCETVLIGKDIPRNHPLTIAKRFADIDKKPLYTVRTMVSTNKTVDILNDQFERLSGEVGPSPYMVLKNISDAGVCNGDVGLYMGEDNRRMLLQLPCGREVLIPRSLTRLAWNTTVNKSQGTEYDSAEELVEYCTSRRQIYTAITRAKKRFALICTLHSLRKAIQRIEPERISFLGKLYTGESQLIEG